MQEQEVTFMYKSNRIHGLITVSDSARPLIVLTHGMTADKHRHGMYDTLTQRLYDEGFAVGRIDVSGRGASSGDFQDTSVSLQAEEVTQFVKEVSAYDFIDSSGIGAFGHSLGTCVILACDELFSVRVLSAPVEDPFAVIPLIFGDTYDPNGVSTRIAGDGKPQNIGPQFFSDLRSHDFETLFCSQEDTLCIVGEFDPLREPGRDLPSCVEQVVLEGADHGFKEQWDEMCDLTVSYFVDKRQ